MYSDYIERCFGDIICENKKLKEQLLEVRKKLQNKNEIIQKYEKLMKEKGIVFE